MPRVRNLAKFSWDVRPFAFLCSGVGRKGCFVNRRLFRIDISAIIIKNMLCLLWIHWFDNLTVDTQPPHLDMCCHCSEEDSLCDNWCLHTVMSSPVLLHSCITFCNECLAMMCQLCCSLWIFCRKECQRRHSLHVSSELITGVKTSPLHVWVHIASAWEGRPVLRSFFFAN